MEFNLEEFVVRALEEDVRDGDHTSNSCIPEDAEKKARLLCKADGIIAGVDLAVKIFDLVDSNLKVEVFIKDGAKVKVGDVAFTVEGSARKILMGERLVLNLMQRMSGIATKTFNVTDKVKHTKVKILDTRKTTPTLRYFEKLAVRIGGGHNHRFGLYDMVMIKDNHVDYAGGISQAVTQTKKYLAEKGLNIAIEVEARNMDEVEQILAVGGVDRIMLDNFSPERIVEALKVIDGKAESEASGGIDEDTVVSYAETGVDYLSMGALTHSFVSLDMSLKAMD